MSVDLTDLFATFSSVTRISHTPGPRPLSRMALGNASTGKHYNDCAKRANEHLRGGSIIGHTLFSDEQCAPVGTSWFFFLWGEMRRSHLQ